MTVLNHSSNSIPRLRVQTVVCTRLTRPTASEQTSTAYRGCCGDGNKISSRRLWRSCFLSNGGYKKLWKKINKNSLNSSDIRLSFTKIFFFFFCCVLRTRDSIVPIDRRSRLFNGNVDSVDLNVDFGQSSEATFGDMTVLTCPTVLFSTHTHDGEYGSISYWFDCVAGKWKIDVCTSPHAVVPRYVHRHYDTETYCRTPASRARRLARERPLRAISSGRPTHVTYTAIRWNGPGPDEWRHSEKHALFRKNGGIFTKLSRGPF